MGPVTKGRRLLVYHVKQVNTFRCGVLDPNIDTAIKKFWEVDSVPLTETSKFQNKEETRAYNRVRNSMKLVQGRYQV